MLDKISNNISKLLDYTVTSADLISYDKEKIIKAKRVDERKSN